MSTAEQKIELVKMLVDADKETTEKLFQYMNELSKKSQKFTEQEIAMFQKTRDEYFSTGEKGYSIEEAHTYIRNANKK